MTNIGSGTENPKKHRVSKEENIFVSYVRADIGNGVFPVVTIGFKSDYLLDPPVTVSISLGYGTVDVEVSGKPFEHERRSTKTILRLAKKLEKTIADNYSHIEMRASLFQLFDDVFGFGENIESIRNVRNTCYNAQKTETERHFLERAERMVNEKTN